MHGPEQTIRNDHMFQRRQMLITPVVVYYGLAQWCQRAGFSDERALAL